MAFLGNLLWSALQYLGADEGLLRAIEGPRLLHVMLGVSGSAQRTGQQVGRSGMLVPMLMTLSNVKCVDGRALHVQPYLPNCGMFELAGAGGCVAV